MRPVIQRHQSVEDEKKQGIEGVSYNQYTKEEGHPSHKSNYETFPRPENFNNDVESTVEIKVTGWRKYLGMIFTLVASLSFSFGILFAKLLQTYGYNGNCSSFWRNVGITIPGIPFLLMAEYKIRNKYKSYDEQFALKSKEMADVEKPQKSMFDSVWPITKGENWKTAVGIFFRGFFAAAAVLLRYYALQYLPIGDTLVIAYSTPIFVTIFAHFILKERADIISFIIVFSTLAGVVIIAKPPFLTGNESFTSETMIGMAFAITALLFGSIQIILMRAIRDVHFALLTLATGLIGLAISGLLTIHFQDFVYPTSLTEGLYVLGLTSTSYLGQMAIILALTYECAAPVALFRSFDIVVGFVLQFLFLGVIPEWTSVLGAFIVVTGVVVTGVRKYLGK